MRMDGAARLLAVVFLNSILTFSCHASQAEGESVVFDGGQVISEGRAREIAWSAGLVHVEEITRSGDRWELAGRTVDDDEITLDIDVRDGRILN